MVIYFVFIQFDCFFFNKNIKLSPLKAVFLALVEQIRFRAAQINDLRATIAILFLDRTFFAVIGVGNTRPTANYASTLIGTVVAFVANTD